MKKKKVRPVFPKCEGLDCGIDLRPMPGLDPKRKLCVMCALECGIDITAKE